MAPEPSHQPKKDKKKINVAKWWSFSFIWWITWRTLIAIFILRYVKDAGRDMWTYIAIILFPEFWFLWEIWNGRVKIVRQVAQKVST